MFKKHSETDLQVLISSDQLSVLPKLVPALS